MNIKHINSAADCQSTVNTIGIITTYKTHKIAKMSSSYSRV